MFALNNLIAFQLIKNEKRNTFTLKETLFSVHNTLTPSVRVFRPALLYFLWTAARVLQLSSVLTSVLRPQSLWAQLHTTAPTPHTSCERWGLGSTGLQTGVPTTLLRFRNLLERHRTQGKHYLRLPVHCKGNYKRQQ